MIGRFTPSLKPFATPRDHTVLTQTTLGRCRTLCALVVTLSLSGCIVGDGIAHVVKLTQENQQTSSAEASGAVVPAATAAPRDELPPPPPAAAPARGAVSVETLAPPR